MNPRFPLLLALAAIAAPPSFAQAPPQRTIELAICLDISGSMDGLLNAARANLWAIVNRLATSKPLPRLRVALLSYGCNAHVKERGWVKVESEFTEDLDALSKTLFSFTTNGGEEYVGRVLQSAIDELAWQGGQEALKIIVVAGNEAATQDPQVDFHAVCKRAIERGIVVNSIYCGNPADQLAPAWREVATLADGAHAAIDQDHGQVTIPTPFDDLLTTASAELNQTYLPFGKHGVAGCENQWRQDANAAKLDAGAAAQRAQSKCTGLYSNAAWDLVDACRDAAFELAKVKDEDLPEPMRAMDAAARTAHVKAMGAQREKVQQRITELSKKRDAFVAEELKRRAVDSSRSFEHAMLGSIQAQAEAKGFVFQKAVVKN